MEPRSEDARLAHMRTRPRPGARLIAWCLALVVVLAACSSAGGLPSNPSSSATPGQSVAPSPSGPPPAAIDPETPVVTDAPPGGGDPGLIPGAGRIVVPKPGQFDVRPISAQTLSAQVDGRRVVIAIDYTSGVEPCYVLDSILVQPGPRSFAITLREGNGGGT